MATNDLQGKVAVITGGSRGIGFSIAKKLLGLGAKVAICSIRQNSVDNAVTELSPLGELLGIVADVSKLEDVKRMVAAVVARFGTIDVLINNAAIMTYRPITELEPAEFEKMLAVNLTGAYYCSHEILPIFKHRGAGDVINISSLAGAHAFAGGSGYNASKFGLVGLSEATLLDHRYDGVRVSTVMPGSVDTKGGNHADWKVAPEDIADVVALLLQMPRRTTVSKVEVRPTKPSKKSEQT